MRICDFCNGERNKGLSFNFKMFENIKIPRYRMMQIDFMEVDLCASCYADIFNLNWIQEKLKAIHLLETEKGK